MNFRTLRQKAQRYAIKQGLVAVTECVDSDEFCKRGRFVLYAKHELLGMVVIDTTNHSGICHLLTPEEMEPKEAAE